MFSRFCFKHSPTKKKKKKKNRKSNGENASKHNQLIDIAYIIVYIYGSIV